MKLGKLMLIISIITICIIGLVPQNISNAQTIKEVSEQFQAKDNEKVSYDTLKEIIGKVLGFLQVATGLITVIIFATTGYSYIVATPDIKREVKAKMLPIVLGTVLVFSAISISKFIIGSIES